MINGWSLVLFGGLKSFYHWILSNIHHGEIRKTSEKIAGCAAA
jgi:hypothetical protein